MAVVFISAVIATLYLLPSCFCLVATPPAKILKSHHPFTEQFNSSQWECPTVENLSGVSCGCDLPHTVRCRGNAASPSTITQLSEKLRDSHVSLLDLAVHEIGTVPDEVFSGLQLLGLVISSGNVSELNERTFKGIEGTLAALGLPSNAFKKIPIEALQPLTRLQRLDFSDNQLEHLPSRTFPTLIQLHSLSLASNKIRSIEPQAFVKLPQMRSLNLAGNQLDASQISDATLWGLHFLKDFSLQNNLLKGTLTPDFISGAKSISNLDLSHNAITSITIGALQSYTNLRILDLSHNNIDVIEDHSFRHLPQLRELILSHNRIVGVSGWSLSHIPKLTTLRLADNAMLTVTADLVHQLPALISLDLAANDISLIQTQVFNVTPHLQHLNLADNPLHCDCSLLWLQDWLRSRGTLSGAEKRAPTCATPLHLQNAPLTELKKSELSCSEDSAYHDYHDFYSDYYHDAATPELRLSEAEVSLQLSRWTSGGLQLLWSVDEKALPYDCEAVFVYEVQQLTSGPHQLLTEKVDANCSSEAVRNPQSISVTIPENVLQVGATYRYCLVLLEYGTGDQEGFLPGCSEPLLLTSPPPNLLSFTEPPPEVNSLTAGEQRGLLVVHTRIRSSSESCKYTIVLVRERQVVATQQLNCSEPRYSFSNLGSGQYVACIKPDNISIVWPNIRYLEHNLRVAENTTQVLQASFPACTPLIELHFVSTWKSNQLFILLFTLPGLALILTLYVIGRKVWRGGGVPWRWDPRATKSAKYFLYTGENTTPSVSLDPIPTTAPETTTNV